jgi:hypothetical protein
VVVLFSWVVLHVPINISSGLVKQSNINGT